MAEPQEGAAPEMSQELAGEHSAAAQPEAQESALHAAASATADANDAISPAAEASTAAQEEPAAPAAEPSKPATPPADAHQEASIDSAPAKPAAAPAAPEAPAQQHKPSDADSAPAADAGHKAAAAAVPQQQAKAAPKPAAAPAPAVNHADEEQDVQQQESAYKLEGGHSSYNPHKETAFERLTMPTAMRLLMKFGWTPENASTFHIASGVSYNSKRLAPDEISSMVDRLCTVKPADSNDPGKLHAVKLVYDENGKESYVPVKEVTKDENIAYMSQLYERCQETRQKTHETLAAKYLQPLGKPRKAA